MNKISTISNYNMANMCRVLPLAILGLIFMYGISSTKAGTKTFSEMIRNVNNEEYINAFFSQQPRITYYLLQRTTESDVKAHSAVIEGYNFDFGSWEYQPFSIPKDEEGTVI